MNTTSLFKNNRLCKALTGVSVEELKNLLPSFEEALKRERKLRKPERKRAVGAGQKGTLHKAEQKLVFILIYLKTYPTFDVLGFLTGRERSRACRWVHRLLPVVEHALGRHAVLPKRQIRTPEEFFELFPEAKDAFIDGTERRVEKPKKKKKQNKLYSGKKKGTTRKNIIVADEKRRVLVLSPTKSGRRHDKRLADKVLSQNIYRKMSPLGETPDSRESSVSTAIPSCRTKQPRSTLSPTNRNKRTSLSQVSASLPSTRSVASSVFARFPISIATKKPTWMIPSCSWRRGSGTFIFSRQRSLTDCGSTLLGGD